MRRRSEQIIGRETLSRKLLQIVSADKRIPIDDISAEVKYKQRLFSQGIYLMYDSSNRIIYIGQLKGGEKSSLYNRLYGQGRGAHCRKIWFGEISYVRFHQFDHLWGHQLDIVERLIIWAAGQPVHNDVDTDACDIE